MKGSIDRIAIPAIALVVVIITLALAQSGWLWRFDRIFYDSHFRFWPRQAPPEIVIVTIDDTSIDRLGKWPWPRAQHAELIDILSEAGARAIGIDLLLSEPDLQDPMGDALLADAIGRSGRVVLPVSFREVPGVGLVETLPTTMFKPAALGHTQIELDADGIGRSVYLRAGMGDARWLVLPLALLTVGDQTEELQLPGLRRDPKSDISPYAWVQDHFVLTPFVGPNDQFQHYSFADVVTGVIPPAVFKDKFVLVGATAVGLGDAIAVPMPGPSRQMPGVEVNANLLAAYLSETYMVPFAPGVVLSMTAALVLLTFCVYPFVGPIYGAAVAVTGTILAPLISLLLLRYAGCWFPPVAAMLGIVAGYCCWLWYRLVSASNTLRQERRQALVTLESVGDAVVTVDRGNRVVYMNPVAEDMTGCSLEEARGKRFEEVVRLRNGTSADPGKVMLGRDSKHNGRQQTLTRRDGTSFVVRTSIRPMKSKPSVEAGTVVAIADITATHELAKRMAYQATHDTLTDLPNRSLMMDRLQQSLAHARRNDDLTAVLFIDLDRFKLVNDALGHAPGDRLLVAIARRLEKCLRGTDTVARVGGDEFVVILEAVDDIRSVAVIARKMLDSLQSPVDIDGQECLVSGSIGISIYPRDAADADELLKFADIAMYHVKERGRNGYRFYTKEMDRQARERLGLEHDLRRALEREELELHFQPIVNVVDGKVTAAEALLRWRTGGELRNAGEFVPIAEESGLVVPIGEWVLAKACKQAKDWSDSHANIRIDVNLSPRQLYLSGIAKSIERLLSETHCDPSLLGLEITETAMMTDMEIAKRTIHELKALGIHISVDDFGMGYSSLSYLKQFPIDRLKIDRSFVSGADSDTRDAALATAIIGMAHSMKLTATAEGVETKEQASFLASHNCDELQGFYFGRPSPASEFVQNLTDGIVTAPSWH